MQITVIFCLDETPKLNLIKRTLDSFQLRQLSCLPLVTAENVSRVCLQINGNKLNLGDLKSLDKSLTVQEKDVIIEETYSVDASNGQLTSNLVAAYLSLICDDQFNISSTPSIVEGFISEDRQLFTAGYSWRLVNNVLLPYFVQSHWVIIILNCRTRTIAGKLYSNFILVILH